jgi:hypothetical protein
MSQNNQSTLPIFQLQNYVSLDRYNQVVTNNLVPAVNTLVRVVNSIPQNIYSTSIDISTSIAGKLTELGDAYSGKGTNSSNTDFVQINQKHFDYLEKIRKTDRAKYMQYEKLSQTLVNLTNEQQIEVVKLYFKVNVVQDERSPSASS